MNEQSSRVPPLPQLTGAVCAIARDAAREILKIYNSEFTIEHKDDRSPLTAADMAAHDTICRGLQDLTPDIPVLSEESVNIPFSTRKNWQYYWLVDPLDGTREFIKRNGEFTVNIALIDKHAPVLGVIHVPVTGTCYFACQGHGASKKSGDGGPVTIKTRATRAGSFSVAGSRSHGSDKQQAFFRKLGDIEIHAIGSALKFCLVAEGLVDIYPRFGPTSEWDTAAAQCIVEEAGGIVTGLDLEPLRYNSKESLLNPDFLAIADRSFDWQPYLNDL